MTKQIEIEFRALLTPEKYRELEKFLQAKGEDLGEDDKEVTYFLFPEKLLKVVKNTSKSTAKLSLKLKRLGYGADFEESEIPISPDDIEKTIKIFENLGFKHHDSAVNQRHNYLYQGVEFALKVSSDLWQHHLEMELMVDDPADQAAAEQKIKALAQELDIKLMTDSELLEFEAKIKQDKNLKENGIN